MDLNTLLKLVIVSSSSMSSKISNKTDKKHKFEFEIDHEASSPINNLFLNIDFSTRVESEAAEKKKMK
jgi:hypothetical protein